MSPPDSALANLQQTIDDLERQLLARGQSATRDAPGRLPQPSCSR
jgi:hypothetical protein